MPGTGVRFGMQTLKTNENSSINSITEDRTCIDQVIIYFFVQEHSIPRQTVVTECYSLGVRARMEA